MTAHQTPYEKAKKEFLEGIIKKSKKGLTDLQFLNQVSEDLDNVVRQLYKQEVGKDPKDLSRTEILQELSTKKSPTVSSEVTSLSLTSCIILEEQNGINSFLRQVIAEALNKARRRRQDNLRLQQRLLQNLGMFYAGIDPTNNKERADVLNKAAGRRRMI